MLGAAPAVEAVEAAVAVEAGAAEAAAEAEAVAEAVAAGAVAVDRQSTGRPSVTNPFQRRM